MIMNPVIQGGAEEKVYKITNEASSVMPEVQTSAKAGEIITVSIRRDPGSVYVKTADGVFLEMETLFDAKRFVMPASDVTLTTTPP